MNMKHREADEEEEGEGEKRVVVQSGRSAHALLQQIMRSCWAYNSISIGFQQS